MTDLRDDLSIEPSQLSDERPTSTNNIFKPKRSSDPEKETFWEMIYYNVTPNLTPISFAVIFSVILTIIFIVQLILTGIRLEGQFLESGLNSITAAMAVEMDILREEGNFYRLLTFCFIHSDLPSLIFSVLMMAIWVSGIEVQLGSLRCAIIYVLASVSGCMFGVNFANPGEPIMGSVVGIFGILGATVGYMILNWFRVRIRGLSKLIMFIFVAAIIIMSFLLAQSLAPPMLQLGGILSGVFLGMSLSAPVGGKENVKSKPIYEMIVIIAGALLYVGFLGSNILGFAASR